MEDHDRETKQCRICLCGQEEEQTCGRLIKPCMCKGTMQYVHVKCLNQWRMSSGSKSAFYSCDTCHYSYAFVRTRIVGIATSPVVLSITSLLLFTGITFLASFFIVFFIPDLATPSYSLETKAVPHTLIAPINLAKRIIIFSSRIYEAYIYPYGRGWGYVDDWESVPDGDMAPIPEAREPRDISVIAMLIHRFVLGLSAVGSLSFITWIWQMSIPVSFRFRRLGGNTRENRPDRAGNVTTILILVLVLIGVARTIRKVYHLNRSVAQRVLSTVEDVILEVA